MLWHIKHYMGDGIMSEFEIFYDRTTFRKLHKILLFLFVYLASYSFHLGTIAYAESCEFAIQLKDSSEIEKAGYHSAAPRLTFMGGVNLSDGCEHVNKKEFFGGFSAIEVSNGGKYITAITDSGNFLIGRLEYDSKESKLIAVKDATWAELKLDGEKLNPKLDIHDKFLHQVESVASLNNDSFMISVEYIKNLKEDRTRGVLLRYKDGLYKKSSFDSEPEAIILENDFFNTEKGYNENVEALTTLSDGRLLLLSEGKYDNKPISAIEWKLHQLEKTEYLPRPLSARIYSPEDREWTSIRYASERNLRPSGATTLPSGNVVVLEVYWCGDKRPRDRHTNDEHLTEIRLRRINKDKFKYIHDGDLLVGEELAHFGPTKSKAMDRFEGITSCSKDDKTLLFLISDDNLPNKKGGNQRTLLLMFELFNDK